MPPCVLTAEPPRAATGWGTGGGLPLPRAGAGVPGKSWGPALAGSSGPVVTATVPPPQASRCRAQPGGTWPLCFAFAISPGGMREAVAHPAGDRRRRVTVGTDGRGIGRSGVHSKERCTGDETVGTEQRPFQEKALQMSGGEECRHGNEGLGLGQQTCPRGPATVGTAAFSSHPRPGLLGPPERVRLSKARSAGQPGPCPPAL